MNKTNIEWCTHTWNPVTGCKRGCTYCYARDVHNKRHKAFLEGKLQNMKQYSVPFETIMFHKDRFDDADLRSKKPKTVFLGSMSDPEYYDDGMWEQITEATMEHNQHTFMLLSKCVTAYKDSRGLQVPLPKNCMLGYTIERAENHLTYDRLSYHSRHNQRPFVSIEPLLGYIIKPLPKFELVIVGAMTGKNPAHPTLEMVKSVIDNANGNRIFWKDNIRVLFPDLCVNKEV